MLKKLFLVLLVLVLLMSITTNCFANFKTSGRDLAIGWQISRPASGFCLKIPYQDDYYLQPIFAISMNKQETSTTGHFALGLRGIYNLPKHQDFLPYTGVAVGYSDNFKRAADSSYSNGTTSYEAFFGVEYQKYLLRPALEIGIGGANRYDGSFHAGVIYNLSMMYYF